MSHAPDDYALVIGINDYPRWNDGKKSLKGSVKDAEEFRDWLVDDEGGGLSAANVKLVISTADPLGPRQHVVDDAFRELRELSENKPRRRFYFYFSGHGHSRAGSWQQQSLCLANWSPMDAGAALHLESYIKASVGCLKFGEAVFFLDCCRVRQIAPAGQSSELECGDPQMTDRYSAVLFGSDHYTATYEGEVDEEIRGYFTAGLLRVLKEGTIELGALLDRLKVVVPELAKPKDQTVRAIPADTKIYLGPPGRKPPPDKLLDGLGTALVSTTITVTSNLVETNSPDDPPVIHPGDVSILRDGLLVARSGGYLNAMLAAGTYEVRIDHAEAFETHKIVVADAPVNLSFTLPRRHSASLLSSTIDKREWRTEPVIAASRWQPAGGQQAVFVSLRERDDVAAITIGGTLTIGLNEIKEAYSLHSCEPGTTRLAYREADGTVWSLPIPVAAGWDTHVFVVVKQERPQLGTASISMRPAGAGFDPGDALVDAYERSVADLVSGGPGPDDVMLDALLYGKFRNPLFGVLGAHFLIRRLRRSAEPEAYELDRLGVVVKNLAKLLGEDAPDVVALRVWSEILRKAPQTVYLPVEPPLFSIGFQAFVEATAWLSPPNGMRFDQVALGLDADSPWTLWKSDEGASSVEMMSLSRPTILHAKALPYHRLDAIERLWSNAGFKTQQRRAREASWVTARAEEDGNIWAFHTARNMARVPDWLVSYVRETTNQAALADSPVDFGRLIRRTMLPKNVLMGAIELVAYEKAVAAGAVERASSTDRSLLASDEILWSVSAEKAAEDDDDDGEMSAGAA